MNFNTILYRFGLEPNDFVNRPVEPIETDDGFIYELWQKADKRICPKCGCGKCHIHNYFITETSCCINSQLKETLKIRKVRLYCTKCKKTFTNPIHGIDVNDTISTQVKEMIINEFYKPLSYQEIGLRYNLSKSRIIQLFDENFSFVPRKKMPRTLCIDEKKFNGKDGFKYICILYDFDNRDVVDVLASRQLAYLEEYFENIPLKERENVKYFVCDMYDGYATVKRKYFPNATLIVDLFHITKQLTEAVNVLRIKAMNHFGKESLHYRFMKKDWRLFLCRKEDIPDSFYHEKKTGLRYHYDDLVFECLKYNGDLRIGYFILQDFYHYYLKRNYDEALSFIEHIVNRCALSDSPVLMKVGDTFLKWRYGIACAISRSQNQSHPSNSAAENVNNHIETLIRISYGFNNFKRFRNRILLIRTYKNK